MLNGASTYGGSAGSTGPVVYDDADMCQPWQPLRVVW